MTLDSHNDFFLRLQKSVQTFRCVQTLQRLQGDQRDSILPEFYLTGHSRQSIVLQKCCHAASKPGALEDLLFQLFDSWELELEVSGAGLPWYDTIVSLALYTRSNPGKSVPK